jgi:cytochrome c oxidase subunit IV
MDSTGSSMKTDLAVYVAILALACVQVFILKGNLAAMLVVALIQAFLAVGFFMHLFSEKRSLLLALVPATVFVLMMMNMIWSDSFRLIQMRPFPK